MAPSRTIRITAHLTAGAIVALTAVFFDQLLGNTPQWGMQQSILLAAGLAVAAAAFLPPIPILSRLSTNVCLALTTTAALLAAAEGLFRAIDYDFARYEQAWHAIPPYYRQPIVPTGEAYFRRPGPDAWTGRVRSAFLVREGYLDHPYPDEPVITVRYDRDGFRNPPGLTDWDIAVAGDSFTELGQLSSDQIFTSILSADLGLTIRNLGTSYTGPLTHLSYLREFGVAEHTRHAMIVFFEGNDLKDLAQEHEALRRLRDTGRRDRRTFDRQPSVLRELNRRVGQLVNHGRQSHASSVMNARFIGPDGPIPLRIHYAPPSKGELSEESLTQLEDFFTEYARFGRERGVTLWLAYMPCKLRVNLGHIEFTDDADGKLRTWQPSDLSGLVKEGCRRHGIRFVDLTPALVDATNVRCAPLYNPIDTHLNAAGSQVVADALATQLAGLATGRSSLGAATASPKASRPGVHLPHPSS